MIQRGEIYFVNLSPVQGREQAGQRPVLVLSIDDIKLPLVSTIVVGTKGANVPRDYPTNVRVAVADRACQWNRSSYASKFAR
jgi:mRNA interferase MazF